MLPQAKGSIYIFELTIEEAFRAASLKLKGSYKTQCRASLAQYRLKLSYLIIFFKKELIKPFELAIMPLLSKYVDHITL